MCLNLIDLIVITLFLTLTGWIAGYREVESMEKQGNWVGWSRLKFWKYMKIFKWKFKILDSYHFMGGLRTLLNVAAFVIQSFWFIWYGITLVNIFLFIQLTNNVYLAFVIAVAHIPLYWWFWYYQRNIFMHIIARKKEYRQSKYWNPFQIKKEK